MSNPINTPGRIPRRTAITLAGLSLAGVAAGCSSQSVGSASGSAAPAGGASSAAAGKFDSIMPTGDTTAFSKSLVTKSLAGNEGFVPPSTGPKAQKSGAKIAYVAGDLSNGGHNAIGKAVTEAAKVIGWTVATYDGQGTAQGNTDAMNQAITSQPAAIVLGGLDPTEQAPAIKQATDAGIPVIGWHAGVLTGPGNGMVTNVSTEPLKVAQLAAAYAVADSDGKAGVVIFTDSQYELAVTKARAMEAYIKASKGCSVLSFQDSPIATADQRMPGLVSNLLQQYSSKLNYLMAINGNYFGGAAQALRDAGKPKDGPPECVAAGDGDAAEIQRIRTSNYQSATVAEPITLQGWQLVDEVNRKLAGQGPSGFVASPGLITKKNVPTGDVFDPPSGFRDVYKKVWGK